MWMLPKFKKKCLKISNIKTFYSELIELEDSHIFSLLNQSKSENNILQKTKMEYFAKIFKWIQWPLFQILTWWETCWRVVCLECFKALSCLTWSDTSSKDSLTRRCLFLLLNHSDQCFSKDWHLNNLMSDM